MLDGPVALHQRAEKHAPTAIGAYAGSRTGECSAVYGEAFFCVLTASRMPIPGFLRSPVPVLQSVTFDATAGLIFRKSLAQTRQPAPEQMQRAHAAIGVANKGSGESLCGTARKHVSIRVPGHKPGVQSGRLG